MSLQRLCCRMQSPFKTTNTWSWHTARHNTPCNKHLQRYRTWKREYLKGSQNMLWSYRTLLILAADLIWFRRDQVDELCNHKSPHQICEKALTRAKRCEGMCGCVWVLISSCYWKARANITLCLQKLFTRPKRIVRNQNMENRADENLTNTTFH